MFSALQDEKIRSTRSLNVHSVTYSLRSSPDGALLRLGGIIVISISCTLSIHPQDLMEIYKCEILPDAEFPDASFRGLSGVV